jgi:hypothetical protein
MTSSRKSESARANGAKSSGPTTQEGKLVSSQNATQHGIFSRTMILGCESQHRFEQVLAELKEQVQPRNSAESGYVEMMAMARWRQMRVWAVQKTAIELEMARLESAGMESARAESAKDGASETAPADLTPVVLATLAYQTLSDNNLLDKLHRYETSYDRQYAKAQAAIQKLRRQELLDAKDSAFLPSNPAASVPHLATPLSAPTFVDPHDSRENSFLQNEPTAHREKAMDPK